MLFAQFPFLTHWYLDSKIWSRLRMNQKTLIVRRCGKDKIMWYKGTAQKRRSQGYLKSLRKRHFASKKYNMQNNSKSDDGVINKINKKNNEKWIVGFVSKLFYGQDREQHALSCQLENIKLKERFSICICQSYHVTSTNNQMAN